MDIYRSEVGIMSGLDHLFVAIEAVTDRNASELPPLTDFLYPDALNVLFGRYGAAETSVSGLSFRYGPLWITIGTQASSLSIDVADTVDSSRSATETVRSVLPNGSKLLNERTGRDSSSALSTSVREVDLVRRVDPLGDRSGTEHACELLEAISGKPLGDLPPVARSVCPRAVDLLAGGTGTDLPRLRTGVLWFVHQGHLLCVAVEKGGDGGMWVAGARLPVDAVTLLSRTVDELCDATAGSHSPSRPSVLDEESSRRGGQSTS